MLEEPELQMFAMQCAFAYWLGHYNLIPICPLIFVSTTLFVIKSVSLWSCVILHAIFTASPDHNSIPLDWNVTLLLYYVHASRSIKHLKAQLVQTPDHHVPLILLRVVFCLVTVKIFSQITTTSAGASVPFLSRSFYDWALLVSSSGKTEKPPKHLCKAPSRDTAEK